MTAVELFKQRLIQRGIGLNIKDFEEAKELEKEQIIDACIFFHLHYGGGMIMPSEEEFQELAEKYYNETFKNK